MSRNGARELLLDPNRYNPEHFDAGTRRSLRAVIDWFESRGKAKLLADYHGNVFYQDFLDFVAEEKLFATFLTPARDAGGDPDKRWDTARVAALSEILGVLRPELLVPVAGHHPRARARSGRATTPRPAPAPPPSSTPAASARSGSRRRSTAPTSTRRTWCSPPTANGGWTATGGKYYIGNGNCATTVSVFGRIAGVEGADQYVFFLRRLHAPELPRRQERGALADVRRASSGSRTTRSPQADILHTGDAAFSAALNTVNIGKFNLCFGGIGLTTHAFVRGDHPRAEPGALRQARHRRSRRSAASSSTR